MYPLFSWKRRIIHAHILFLDSGLWRALAIEKILPTNWWFLKAWCKAIYLIIIQVNRTALLCSALILRLSLPKAAVLGILPSLFQIREVTSMSDSYYISYQALSFESVLTQSGDGSSESREVSCKWLHWCLPIFTQRLLATSSERWNNIKLMEDHSYSGNKRVDFGARGVQRLRRQVLLVSSLVVFNVE